MRPFVAVNLERSLAYYPIRKAASSSLGLAVRGSWTPWQHALKAKAIHFTVVRNPLARLASLYVGSVNPARTGFYQPWTRHNIHYNMSFPDFIAAVCNTPNDAHCDDHFVVANWADLIPNLHVHHFADLPAVAKLYNLDLPYIGPSYAAEAPHYTPELEEMVRERFAREFVLYNFD